MRGNSSESGALKQQSVGVARGKGADRSHFRREWGESKEEMSVSTSRWLLLIGLRAVQCLEQRHLRLLRRGPLVSLLKFVAGLLGQVSHLHQSRGSSL